MRQILAGFALLCLALVRRGPEAPPPIAIRADVVPAERPAAGSVASRNALGEKAPDHIVSASEIPDPEPPPAERPDLLRGTARILTRALEDLEKGRFPLCRRRLARLHLIDPAYPPVQELEALLEETWALQRPVPEGRLPAWKDELDLRAEPPRIPWETALRSPPAERWPAIRRALADDDAAAEVLEKLLSIRVAVAFKDTPVEGMLDYLREISGLPLELDSRLSSRLPPGTPISIRVGDIVLDGVIRLSLSRVLGRVTYDVPDGGVLITAPDLR